MVLAPYVSDAHELTHSHDQFHKDDDTAVQSQNQCISSMSDESYKKIKETQMKPILFMGNPSFGIHNQVQPAYADHYLKVGYGSHPMTQPHLVQIAPARVPLPLDLSEDSPVFVNAKQYHGILRRRQIRAKLEAQNKLVKNRKPYLHESRHKHAVNRVRGSGGRFLPTKQNVKRLSSSDSHSSGSGSGSGSGSEYVMMNHGFSWG